MSVSPLVAAAMRRKWDRWRFARRSLTRYVVVPALPRITAAGLQSQVSVVAVNAPSYF